MNPFEYATAADYVAFGAMAVVFVAGVYMVILLGDLPAGIAKKRNHPQLAAVQAMSWLGLLFTGGIVWILAMIWAYYDYSACAEPAANEELQSENEALRERLANVESGQVETGGAS
jgi:hypothetical protein